MEKILIVDFGSQFTQLIARRVRQCGVFSEIVSASHFEKIVNADDSIVGVVLSGGPNSVCENGSPTLSLSILNINKPVLAICYGMQLLCHLEGGKVSSSEVREFGYAEVSLLKSSPLMKNFLESAKNSQVWMSHGDKVTEIPSSFEVVASTKDCHCAVVQHKSLPVFGIQFHPEVVHTIFGNQIFDNFIGITGAKRNWNSQTLKDTLVEDVRRQIGDGRAVCAISGGVDSAVAAAIVAKAIGKNLHCIFVNNGLLRLNEESQVRESLLANFDINLSVVDASNLFMEKLAGVVEPEQKRKIIGECFIRVFEESTKAIENCNFLVQGTIYPDVIESGKSVSGHGAVIKSHHNVGGLPENMKLKVVEPLRSLFKDEVRSLGLELGISKKLINRHPFPGPGLAIRIIGEVTRQKVAILQQADKIFIDELHANNLYDKTWQAFCVLTDTKTVGVMGDGRNYDNVVAIRAVNSIDGMTATFFPFEMDFLRHVSNRITNEVSGVCRVVYDITSKPPATIEWE